MRGLIVCLLLVLLQIAVARNDSRRRPCGFQCRNDHYCGPGQCCIRSHCGGTTCARLPNYNTCALKNCPLGTRCVDSPYGARCYPYQIAPPPRNQVCFLPLDDGPCDDDLPRFYYNQNLGTCLPFRFSGCGGNANNFYSHNQCLNACNVIIIYDD